MRTRLLDQLPAGQLRAVKLQVSRPPAGQLRVVKLLVGRPQVE